MQIAAILMNGHFAANERLLKNVHALTNDGLLVADRFEHLLHIVVKCDLFECWIESVQRVANLVEYVLLEYLLLARRVGQLVRVEIFGIGQVLDGLLFQKRPNLVGASQKVLIRFIYVTSSKQEIK